MRETQIQQQIRAVLNHSSSQCRVWRNNVGGTATPSGGWIDYGLAPGSADLIGIRKVIITPEMVGKIFGQFCSVEVKTPIGRIEDNQVIWQNTIRRFGGVSEFWRSPDSAKAFVSGNG